MSIPEIYVLFENSEVELRCTGIVSSSFFIKETIDEFDNLDCIFLKSDVNVSSDAREILQDMLTHTFAELCLNKIVNSETETDREVTFEFTEIGVNYMDINLTENLEIEILLLMDCLDIKAYLVALLLYLSKKGRIYQDIVATVKQRRYEMPVLYTKKKI
jgi:hypothetical protein